jgi:hypothetical protein
MPTNPSSTREGLNAILNGAFLLALGAAFAEVRLPARTDKAALGLRV